MSLDITTVLKSFPGAYCISDLWGSYIVIDHPETILPRTILGKGRKPTKAWENAVKLLLAQKKKGSKATRP